MGVDKLKEMDPKNSFPSLEQAAAFFNKVLQAKAAGISLDPKPADDDGDEEYEEATRSRTNIGSMIMMLDRNKNGVVSEDEFTTFMQQQLTDVSHKFPGGLRTMYKLLD